MTADVLRSPGGAHLRRSHAIPGAIVIALLVFWWVFDWNWFKAPIEHRVQAATGRDFAIEGDLHVRLGRVTTLRAERLRLGNAEWSAQDDMARMEAIEVGIRLWPLVLGRIELAMLHLDKPFLLLERNEEGDGNWQFDNQAESSGEGRPVRIEQLVINGGELRAHEPKLKTDLRLDVDTAAAEANAGPAPLVLKGEGKYRDGAFELSGRVDSPLDLRDTEHPYHVDIRARAGATHARVRGDLMVPMQMDDTHVSFSLSGQDLADLHKLVGIVLPETPPYSLSGQLGHKGSLWSYRKFSGTVGGSDLSGDISVDTGPKRMVLHGDLTSRKLAIDDLAGFLGAGPSARKGKAASPKQQEEARQRAQNPRVLPDHPYDLAKLRSMDADVSLKAAQIIADPLPIQAMTVRLRLEDGLLRLDPLDIKAADGDVSGTIRLDAREQPIDTALDLRAKGLDLPKLMPSMKAQNIGRIGGYVKLRAKGNSVAAMLGTANGEAGAGMGQGRLSNLVLELAGLDIAESLEFLVQKDRTVPVRCAYGDLEAKDGVFTIRALALDTTDTVVFGEGSMNLGDETLALKLKPQPKDMSPLTVRSPLRIAGTLKHPKVRPEVGPIALRALAAAALYVIAPPAAILALIETGPGKDTDCGVSAGHPAPKAVDASDAAVPPKEAGKKKVTNTSAH